MPIDFLSETEHRPWSLPAAPWVMAQRWHDLLFAHWPVKVDALRDLIPAQLEIDTFDGEAWIGIVPFRMSGIRPRFLPAVRGLSNFLELNVRTYVKVNGKPGVWFFSLDAANPIAVEIARATFQLPYYRARMSMTEVEGGFHYRSQRTHRDAPPSAYDVCYGSNGPVYQSSPGSLEHWLTERYCLYTIKKNRVYCGDIHHRPWPLQAGWLESKIDTLAIDHKIDLPDTAPVLHFTSGVDVVVWPIYEVKKKG
ncbi:MAG: DUF2071 domain-containing protein [Verrucomicrobiota bacterium]